jgi:hypothetical protein
MDQESGLVHFVISAFNFPSYRHVWPSNGKCSIILVWHNGPLRSNKRRYAVLINLRCERWQEETPSCEEDEGRELEYTGVPNALLAAMFIYFMYNSDIGKY